MFFIQVSFKVIAKAFVYRLGKCQLRPLPELKECTAVHHIMSYITKIFNAFMLLVQGIQNSSGYSFKIF